MWRPPSEKESGVRFTIPITRVRRVGDVEVMGGILGESGVKGESGIGDWGRSISLAKKLDDTNGAGRTAWGIILKSQKCLSRFSNTGNLLAQRL